MTDRFARPDTFNSPCNLSKYCGGTWSGIIDKLDYIQDLGVTAVQISPIVENIANDTKCGEAYHGYWTSDMYALNGDFGTADDLKRLSNELHRRDMYLMVEVVIEKMAQAIDEVILDDPSPPKINWTQLNPFNNERYYRSFCNRTDWNDTKILQECRPKAEAVALLELNTEDETVASMIQNWAKELVLNYSIDGLHVHAAKDMDDNYLGNFTEAAGVFTMGEACSNDRAVVCGHDDVVSGRLAYSMYSAMIAAFTAGDMLGLAREVRESQKSCEDMSQLGIFLEDKDKSRFASLESDLAVGRTGQVTGSFILTQGS